MKLETMKKILFACICIAFFNMSCNDKTSSQNKEAAIRVKHHLNIPEKGIESLMEANSTKIIEGTDGSVLIIIGEVNRKKVDITIKKGDKIIEERLVEEKESIRFDYEGINYTIDIRDIKKPLIGVGKVNLKIK